MHGAHLSRQLTNGSSETAPLAANGREYSTASLHRKLEKLKNVRTQDKVKYQYELQKWRNENAGLSKKIVELERKLLNAEGGFFSSLFASVKSPPSPGSTVEKRATISMEEAGDFFTHASNYSVESHSARMVRSMATVLSMAHATAHAVGDAAGEA